MNGKIMRLFAIVMVLALAVSMSATGIVYDTDSASAAAILKWLKVPIPSEQDYQLLPGSNVSAIIVTPSGDRLFAGVYNVMGDGDWHVMTSNDGGFEWTDTGYTESGEVDPKEMIVDMALSPNWDAGPSHHSLYVATTDNAYKSTDGGDRFSQMANDPTAGGEALTSIDVAYTDRGYEVLVGTYDNGGTPEVWLWDGAWVPQGAAAGLTELYGVLDVIFSPTYRDDDQIYCVINAEPQIMQPQTLLRGASDPSHIVGDVANWNGYIRDAKFYQSGTLTSPIFCGDGTNGNIKINGFTGRARMVWADDADTASGTWSVFVGLSAYEDRGATGIYSTGDAFKVTFTTKIILDSAVNDLEIRGEDSATNVWSIAVSGSTDSCTILAGLRELNIEGSPSAWTSSIHYSANGGASWMQSYKPCSGLVKETLVLDGLDNINMAETNVIVAPDFESSGISYAATSGHFSGVWVSTTDGTTYNGRGLLDYSIWDITDIEPSPRYATDDTIFMVMAMNQSFDVTTALGVLWQTQDTGGNWELILAMNAMFPLPGINIEDVELARDYPDDKYVFVTGAKVANQLDGPWDCTQILGSADGGNIFTIPVGTDEFVITEFVALGGSEIIAAGWELNTGFNYVWKTDRTAYNWDRADFAREATVNDLEVYDTSILVGTGRTPERGYGVGLAPSPFTYTAINNQGGQAYICHDYLDDFNFEHVGKTNVDDPGNVGDETFIAFDTDYYQNDIVYAGINSSFAGGGTFGEIWRFDLGGIVSPWEQISSAKDAPCPDDWDLFLADGLTPVEFDVSDNDDPPGPNGSTPMNVLGLTCADDGTLYALDQILPTLDPAATYPVGNSTGNGLAWRCANPLEEYIDLGDEPLFEPMGDGLGWPDNGRYLPIIYKDLEVVGGGSNYLFAIGRDSNNDLAVYSYYDTLTSERGTGPIDLIRPPDGSTGVGVTVDQNKVAVVLEWEHAPGAQLYEWEVGLNAQFTTKVAHAQFLEVQPAANVHLTDAESIQGYVWPEDSFYWHVRVVEPYLSEWSETWQFDTTPESSGPGVELISPTGDATGVSLKPVLQWSIAVNADCFEVVLAKDCDWSSPTFQKETGEETVAQVTSTLAYGSNYCWKVTAYHGGCDGTELGTSYGAFTTVEEEPIVEPEGTPFWVWLVIGIAAILLIAVIALIVLTKRT